MSFVVAAPEQVQAAAQRLAGIRSMLGEASASVAAPTTGLLAAAQDEVSAGVAAFFNTFGQEYQLLNSQAQAFHQQFVNLMNAGAGAYLSTDGANAEQHLLNAANPTAQGLVGQSRDGIGAVASALGAARAAAFPGFAGGGVRHLPGSATALPGALTGLAQTGASAGSVVGPYQALLQNTVANWQTFTAGTSANPNPFLHQVITNQMGYAKEISSQFAYEIQNFPAVLAGAPATIQAGIQGLLAYNPGPYVQQIIINQMIYGELTYSSLQSAGSYFSMGLRALPPYLESAYHYTLMGNYTAAQGELFQGLTGLFISPPYAEITGESLSLNITFQNFSFLFLDLSLPASVTANLDAGIVPVGTVGALLPILTIPGMEAQEFTNLLPGGSIAQQIAQNFTNVVNKATDTTISLSGILGIGINWGSGFLPAIPPAITGTLGLNANFGLPVALGLDAAGGPVNAWYAFNASTQAFNNAALSGHYGQAATAFIQAPANITNAFLNGRSTIPFTSDIDGIPITLNFPADGILVGTTPATLTLDNILTIPIGGTPISGLVPGLYYASQQLANAITP
ncbi:PE family protein [Mycobacterium sp.]|uniref:PE family protein n=1 Tax=Mycobacterium sp. TaxID=1785 RepID=UPI0025F5F7DE|nr:PE family protein [Mycobacterium sp.]MBW0013287.1 PE family protein [Mycobacterium sp.]